MTKERRIDANMESNNNDKEEKNLTRYTTRQGSVMASMQKSLSSPPCFALEIWSPPLPCLTFSYLKPQLVFFVIFLHHFLLNRRENEEMF